MTIKDIMVHVDASPKHAGRLAAAAALAKRFDAHLKGLYVPHAPAVPKFVMAQLGPEVREVQQEYARQSEATARQLFEAHCQEAGLDSEWVAVPGELLTTTAFHTRFSDLVIVGQADPDADLEAGEAILPDRLVMETGRPILVVPFEGGFPDIGRKRVLLGWNSSRESARAASDALPFLREAEKVEVLIINPRPERDGEVPGAGIVAHLARHGVQADLHTMSSGGLETAQVFLSRVEETQADLVVMGAYGRPRFTELVLGGVTHRALHQLPVPVLMAH